MFYTDIFSGAAGEGEGAKAWGIDLSHHSDNVDFAALKAAGPQVPTDPYTVKGFGKFTMNVAVQDGVIAQSRIEESVRRILLWKYELDLFA